MSLPGEEQMVFVTKREKRRALIQQAMAIVLEVIQIIIARKRGSP